MPGSGKWKKEEFNSNCLANNWPAWIQHGLKKLFRVHNENSTEVASDVSGDRRMSQRFQEVYIENQWNLWDVRDLVKLIQDGEV